MGRTILCPHCKSTFDENVLAKRSEPNICPVCEKPLDNNADGEDHSDWITWWYYRDPEYGDFSLWDKPPLRPEELELIKEFQAPPRDSSGSSEKAKEILRTYIPGAFMYSKNTEPIICCPRCGCQEYTLLNRGYSIFTGFLGSGKVKRVCNRCKKEF